jgi:hypothetical protein
MNNSDRFQRNKLGQDPAYQVEQQEPRHGYTRPHFYFSSPSPKATQVMTECIDFAIGWRHNFDLSADVKWKRVEAHQKIAKINSHLRGLNIQLLREYLTCLKGECKARAHRTIAQLEILKGSS